jgi:hypothetical protein
MCESDLQTILSNRVLINPPYQPDLKRSYKRSFLSLVVDAVSSYPVSVNNTLKIGKLQGINSIFGAHTNRTSNYCPIDQIVNRENHVT